MTGDATPERVEALIGRQAAAHPTSVAVTGDDISLTYAELETRSNQLAHRLIGAGIGPGDLVAVHLQRIPALVVAIVGVLKSGAGFVPLDERTPRRKLAFMVGEVRAPIILTQRTLRAELAGIGVATLAVDDDREWRGQPGSPPERRGTAQDTAYVMYTSGSTGRPNGVIVPHRALVNYLTWCAGAYAMHEGRGALVHSPIGFDLTVTTLLGPLIVGQRVLLVRDDGVRALVAALATAEDLTVLKVTPTHLRLLSLLLSPADVAGRVRTLVVGGEGLWADELELFRGLGGPVRIVNEYGPTETVVGSCAHRLPPDAPPSGRVPIGRPISGTAIDVVDQALRRVPAGEPGEALIRGAGVTDGYLDRPEVTAARFVPDPSGQPGRRAYRTGDIVRQRPDGELEFLGRNDDQVKILGIRVEPAEIAAALRAHPAVADAAVTVTARPTSAPIDDVRPVAFVVAAPGTSPDSSELVAHCRERLSEQLVPAVFHLVESLPSTPNGKLDRAALRALVGSAAHPTGAR
uniref:Non-ribosomal peptide synthase n=1 Tax=uncultured bacterium AB_9 TaxID=1630012 RepID=A0A0E3JHU4_9BACT|nr:non-ribosomal peptide synthase [uncultured bacterium AB_9]